MVNWLAKTNNAKVGNLVNAVEQVPQNQSAELPVRVIQRRSSVAGRSLFNVNNETRETGWDFLPKVDVQNQNNRVVHQSHRENFETVDLDQEMVSQEASTAQEIGESSGIVTSRGIGQSENDVESRKFAEEVLKISSNFNPFLRLPNPPFTLNGRRRAQSVDCISRRPSLSTIFEVDENSTDNSQNEPLEMNQPAPTAASLLSCELEIDHDTPFAAIEDLAIDDEDTENDVNRSGPNFACLVDSEKPSTSNEGIEKERLSQNAIVSKWVERFNAYSL